MTKTPVVAFCAPDSFSADPLTDLLRQGVRQLIGQAVEAELSGFLAAHADQTDTAGRRRSVRHGHLPERDIQTGIGAVSVQVPRVRGRASAGVPLRFTSTILRPYLRRARRIEELLPWLYLKSICTGDFSEPLAAPLGQDAPSLSATTITRLKADWWGDYERWSKRDRSTRRYVYFWADGVYFTPRMDEDRQCMLVIIRADEWGNKDVLGLIDGFRESTQSWRELLLNLKRRGLEAAPKLAFGDGAMGFWAALHEVTARRGCSAAGFTRRRRYSMPCRNRSSRKPNRI